MSEALCPLAESYTFSFFFSSRRRHTRSLRDWSSDVCSSDLPQPKEYARAEAIYQRALAEPTLEMRADVLDRLADLHLEQGHTDAAAVWRQQAEVERRQWLEPLFAEPAVTPSIMAGATHKLGRNERCWC